MSDSSSITREQLHTVLISTELGGKKGDSDHFSYAKLDGSTYSFGEVQFDVGNNRTARHFLKENGFNDADITNLSSHGGLSRKELDALDAKLQAIPKDKLDQLTNQWLDSTISRVNVIVDNVRNQNPAAADVIVMDTKLQLGVADYANQFSERFDDQLAGFLAGKTERGIQAGNPPTREDVQSFIRTTPYGQNPAYARAIAGREARFNEAMIELGLGVAATLEQGIHSHAVTTLQADLAAFGYTDGHGHPLKADGDFGLETRHAVERFQHDHHLAVDGVVGPQTQKALAAAMRPSHEMTAKVGESSVTSATRGVLGHDDPRNTLSPNHALYAELQQRIPEASENRLLQFTAACHSHGITDKNLEKIYFDREGGHMMFTASWPPGPSAVVDLKQSSPQREQSVRQIQQYDQQQAQMMQQIRQDLSQQQTVQGPVLGSPPVLGVPSH